MKLRSFSLPAVLTTCAVVAGCDDGFSPSLSNLRFDGPAKDSATVLLLSVDFHDGDGDLGRGTLATFIDGEPTSAGALELLPIFLRSELPVNATDGTLQFVLELALGGSPPPSGTSFHLGVRATDIAEHPSATDEIPLTLTY